MPRVPKSLVSAVSGGALGAALVAVLAAPMMWTTRSSHDLTAHPLTAISVIAALIGALVLAFLASRLRATSGRRESPEVLALLVAAGLAAWGVWQLVKLYEVRTTLPLADSTGATLIAAAAMFAGVTSAVLAPAAFLGRVHVRAAICVAAVVAVAAPTLIYLSVQDFRAQVWYPDLTSPAAAPQPRPESIGAVGYRIPLDPSDAVVPAGTGFLVATENDVTAYDGPSGDVRWRVEAPPSDDGIFFVRVVRRDADDMTGVAVLFFGDSIVAVDGGTGDVIWRRQYSGQITEVASSIDALGMVIFTAADRTDRTRLHSIDPATGELRFSTVFSCSNPTGTSGTPGQFSFSCGQNPSVFDAHTGTTVDMPGPEYRTAGTDVYVAAPQDAPREGAPPSPEPTLVIDPSGQVIDEIPGTYPVSTAHDGLLLLYAGNDTWVLRDYRNHRSTPVPVSFAGWIRPWDISAAWLARGLAVSSDRRDVPLLYIDSANPAAPPQVHEAPCGADDRVKDLRLAPGAFIVRCRTAAVALLAPTT